MSRIVFLPRVTKSTYDGGKPSLASPDWANEGIHLNELFKLKNTNRFYIYHQIDDTLRIDPVGLSLDSEELFDMFNDTPTPTGEGLEVWNSVIEASNIQDIGGNQDSTLKLVVMDNQQIYSMTLGKLMDKIPHPFRIVDGSPMNDSSFYATAEKNGFARFATQNEVDTSAEGVMATPADANRMVNDSIFGSLPPANESDLGLVRFSTPSEVLAANSIISIVSPANAKSIINATINSMDDADDTDSGISRFATSTEVDESLSVYAALTPADVLAVINYRINNRPTAATGRYGIARFSTPTEVLDATNTNTVITPINLDNIADVKVNAIPDADPSTIGVTKFASSADINANSKTTVVTPADANNMIDGKVNAIPDAAIEQRGKVKFADSDDITGNSNSTSLTPFSAKSIINERIKEIPPADTETIGLVKFANSTEIDESSTDTVLTPANADDIIDKKFEDVVLVTKISDLFNSVDPITLSGEVEHVQSSLDDTEKQISVINKLSTSTSQPSLINGEILKVVKSGSGTFKTLSDEGALSSTYLYDSVTNELRVKWGAHSTLTKIDLTQSPFTNTGNTGLVFEMIYEDDESTIDINEQTKFCIGRTFRLRVTTRIGIGLIFAPTIITNEVISKNGSAVTLLNSSTDKGEFELEFESIDGINVDYLGKRKISVSQVMMRDYDTLALYGSIYSTGSNEHGKLGLGDKASRIWFTEIPNTQWKDIVGGQHHVLALTTAGKLYSWGAGSVGRLGTGSSDNQHSPRAVNTNILGWRCIAAGDAHSLAITNTGRLFGWGTTEHGRLGLGETTGHIYSPEEVTTVDLRWKKVSTGYNHSLGIDENNDLYSWGNNATGELGLNNTTAYRIPIKISNYSTNISGLKWKMISAGWNFSAAIDYNNDLWLWGKNTHGEIGTGNTTNVKIPTKINNGKKWKFVSAGYYHFIAIDTDGYLWGCGLNNYGQLGLGGTGDENTIQKLPVDTKWNNACASFGYSLAIDINGNLWGCGRNNYSQLGDSVNPKYSLDKVDRVTNGWTGISANKKWIKVSAVQYASLAILRTLP